MGETGRSRTPSRLDLVPDENGEGGYGWAGSSDPCQWCGCPRGAHDQDGDPTCQRCGCPEFDGCELDCPHWTDDASPQPTSTVAPDGENRAPSAAAQPHT